MITFVKEASLKASSQSSEAGAGTYVFVFVFVKDGSIFKKHHHNHLRQEQVPVAGQRSAMGDEWRSTYCRLLSSSTT